MYGEPITRPLALFGVMVTGVLAGGLLGAFTNAVNGYVSPYYFSTILGWRNVVEVWRAAVAQGVFEGLLFGAGFSIVFAAGIGIIAHASAPYLISARHLIGVLMGALACWGLGGILAVGIAAISPERFREGFYYAPTDFAALLGFAWVGGSIWGVEIGGLICTVLGLVVFRANWRRQSLGSAVSPPQG